MIMTPTQFVALLASIPKKVVHRGRGAMAGPVDQAAAKAKGNAMASWTRYGRGAAGSAGTIRGRMSRDRSQVVGYVLADGQGAFQSEHGTSTHAPTPVMHQAVESVAGAAAEALGDMAEDLF